MLTALSWLGRISWPVLGTLTPAVSPRLLLVLLGFFAALVIVGGPAGAVWLHMHADKREAMDALNLKWELKVTEDKYAADLEISRQLQAATDAAAAVIPVAAADLAGLCENDPRCTDRGASHQ